VTFRLGYHVSVDRVKIGFGGGFVVFFFLGSQNRNFEKVRGAKTAIKPT